MKDFTLPIVNQFSATELPLPKNHLDAVSIHITGNSVPYLRLSDLFYSDLKKQIRYHNSESPNPEDVWMNSLKHSVSSYYGSFFADCSGDNKGIGIG